MSRNIFAIEFQKLMSLRLSIENLGEVVKLRARKLLISSSQCVLTLNKHL